MVDTQIIRNGCPKCSGNVKFFGDQLSCTECYTITKLPKMNKAQRTALESHIETVDSMIFEQISPAGIYMLRYIEFGKLLLNLERFNNGGTLTDEEKTGLKQAGLLKEKGGIVE